jgi:hypothetical protein
MKNRIDKTLLYAAAAAALSFAPLTAPAQTAPAGGTQTMTTDDQRDHHDYGWLGLVGLLGLAGLMRKRDTNHVAGYSDTRRATTTRT